MTEKEDLEQFREMYEEDYEVNRDRECGEGCGHYDSLNRCCWLVTEKGIMVHVCEGDLCHHGLKEDY